MPISAHKVGPSIPRWS